MALTKGIVEDYHCIKIHDLVSFKSHIEADNKTNKQLLLNEGSIEIKIRLKDKMYSVALPLATSNTQFGGIRLWFECPNPDCRRRVANVYLSPMGEIGCRHCLNLTYELIKHRKSKEYGILSLFHKLHKTEKKLANKWIRNPTKQHLREEWRRTVLALTDRLNTLSDTLRHDYLNDDRALFRSINKEHS